jgi:hypothetical protein
VLVVPRDNLRIGEPYRHIERKSLLRTGKQFGRGEWAIVVLGSFNSQFSIITVVVSYGAVAVLTELRRSTHRRVLVSAGIA